MMGNSPFLLCFRDTEFTKVTMSFSKVIPRFVAPSKAWSLQRQKQQFREDTEQHLLRSVIFNKRA